MWLNLRTQALAVACSFDIGSKTRDQSTSGNLNYDYGTDMGPTANAFASEMYGNRAMAGPYTRPDAEADPTLHPPRGTPPPADDQDGSDGDHTRRNNGPIVRGANEGPSFGSSSGGGSGGGDRGGSGGTGGRYALDRSYAPADAYNGGPGAGAYDMSDGGMVNGMDLSGISQEARDKMRELGVDPAGYKNYPVGPNGRIYKGAEHLSVGTDPFPNESGPDDPNNTATNEWLKGIENDKSMTYNPQAAMGMKSGYGITGKPYDASQFGQFMDTDAALAAQAERGRAALAAKAAQTSTVATPPRAPVIPPTGNVSQPPGQSPGKSPSSTTTAPPAVPPRAPVIPPTGNVPPPIALPPRDTTPPGGQPGDPIPEASPFFSGAFQGPTLGYDAQGRAISEGGQMWGQGGASGNRQLAGGNAYDTYMNMKTNPGLSDPTKSAIIQDSVNSARAGFQGAGEQIKRHAAATGGTGGTDAALANVGAHEAAAGSNAVRSSRMGFEDFARQDRNAGAAGLSNLYGGETSFMNSLLGGRADLAAKPRSIGNTAKTAVEVPIFTG